ncbi:rab5 gdp gtp exchange factor [Stylonychia lemnae]|uniref:Rab5 gdp gtp exchange factor n=1 Tax=Stylonychia lemnae TaxID=5949 RepID=A0A078ADC8_STYLE|nr:rab5 gdp gtp exchange factor [Stylonychia lemnae]|eukprot:CDW79851.1 rab5 gdp gtp exchange factor [Stylonychia lemnae]
MMMHNGGGTDDQQSNQTLFDDLCKLQSLIKHEQNLQSHFAKEKEDYCSKIANQHQEYYKQQLAFISEHNIFNQSIEKDELVHLPKSTLTKTERTLEVKPQVQFGEAFKRIQSLLFMLRENEDVFQVFSQNLYKLSNNLNGSIPETLVNFLFNDLTYSQGLNARFMIIMRLIIKKEVEIAESPDQLLKCMVEKIFKELIKQSDSRRYITYLFKSKYDRIDFNYLDFKDICKVYDGLQRKSSLDQDQVTETTRVNDIVFEIVHNASSAGNNQLDETNESSSRGASYKSDRKEVDRRSFPENKNTSPNQSTHTLSKQSSSNGISNDTRSNTESILITNNDERSSEGKSKSTRDAASSAQQSAATINMINHMHEILEAILDQIFSKVNAMPYVLREFFLVLHNECQSKWGHLMSQQKLFGIISDFLINKWIVPVCFFKLSQNGLTKDFYLGENCKQNLKLLGKLMQRIFKFEEIVYPIKEDKQQKYQFQSMIMNLSDVNFLYQFFKDFTEEFTTKPMRADSMIFSQSLVKQSNEKKLGHMDSLLQKDFSSGYETKEQKYFYFYKFNELQPKKKSDPTYQPSPYERVIADLSHEDKIIQKNLKILLNECDFIDQYGFNIKNKNNISEILKVIEQRGFEREIDLQTAERNQNVSTLIRYSNQLYSRVDQLDQDFKYLELLFKVKKRSQFIQNAKFDLCLYRFEPNDFIEITEGDQQCKHQPQRNDEQDHTAHKMMMQQQQAQQEKELKEREKQKRAPLEGNIAMKFLLKSGDFERFLNKGKQDKNAGERKQTSKQQEELKNSASNIANYDNSPPQRSVDFSNRKQTVTMRGAQSIQLDSISQNQLLSQNRPTAPRDYKKYKQRIKSINDFIQKMIKLPIIGKVLSFDDLEWAGIKQCFADFYEKVRTKVMEDEILSRDVDEHMTEIADFICLRLYKKIFENKMQSQKEYEVYSKIQSLQWLSPDAFGIQSDTLTKPMWDSAVRELCFRLIDSTFSLFSTEEGINTACADDMLQIFPYIVLKAKIERLLGHLKKIQEANYQNEDFFDMQAKQFHEIRLKNKYDQCLRCKKWHSPIEECTLSKNNSLNDANKTEQE